MLMSSQHRGLSSPRHQTEVIGFMLNHMSNSEPEFFSLAGSFSPSNQGRELRSREQIRTRAGCRVSNGAEAEGRLGLSTTEGSWHAQYQTVGEN